MGSVCISRLSPECGARSSPSESRSRHNCGVGSDPPDRLHLAELIAALSLAMDLGLGQPMEQLADTSYTTLLRFVGCTPRHRHDWRRRSDGFENRSAEEAGSSG